MTEKQRTANIGFTIVGAFVLPSEFYQQLKILMEGGLYQKWQMEV
jgi:hypothetical protein